MISNNNVVFSRRLFAKDMSRFARLCRIVPSGAVKSHYASKRMVVAVNSLCRVPGAGPGLQNGGGCWVDNKPFSLTTQCQYSYLLFLLCFTVPIQKIIIFLPAFSDIDKICKLSVSARSVYSSIDISFGVFGFLKQFQTISQKPFTQHIPMASRRLLLRNLHARVKHRQNV